MPVESLKSIRAKNYYLHTSMPTHRGVLGGVSQGCLLLRRAETASIGAVRFLRRLLIFYLGWRRVLIYTRTCILHGFEICQILKLIHFWQTGPISFTSTNPQIW